MLSWVCIGRCGLLWLLASVVFVVVEVLLVVAAEDFLVVGLVLAQGYSILKYWYVFIAKDKEVVCFHVLLVEGLRVPPGIKYYHSRLAFHEYQMSFAWWNQHDLSCRNSHLSRPLQFHRNILISLIRYSSLDEAIITVHVEYARIMWKTLIIAVCFPSSQEYAIAIGCCHGGQYLGYLHWIQLLVRLA